MQIVLFSFSNKKKKKNVLENIEIKWFFRKIYVLSIESIGRTEVFHFPDFPIGDNSDIFCNFKILQHSFKFKTY